MGLKQEAVEAVGVEWSEAQQLNDLLDELAEVRVTSIYPSGDLDRSKIAWKVAVLSQALVYRIVELGRSCTTMWNERRAMSAALLARALIETEAVFLDFEQKLTEALEKGDLESIDQITMHQTFSTRLESWIEDKIGTKSVNILTTIQKLEKMAPNIRRIYDTLSEFSHPNSLGHFQGYGILNTRTGEVRFSEDKMVSRELFRHITIAFLLAGMAKNAFDRIADRIKPIADLQSRGSVT